jgi:anti-anti-sigma factor
MHVAEREQVLVITFQAENYNELWSLIEPHLAAGKRGFVLDCSPVRFLNSLSIAAIITARNKVSQGGGKLVLAGLADHVKSVFRILKLERIFALDMTVDQAVVSAK